MNKLNAVLGLVAVVCVIAYYASGAALNIRQTKILKNAKL